MSLVEKTKRFHRRKLREILVEIRVELKKIPSIMLTTCPIKRTMRPKMRTKKSQLIMLIQ